MKISGFTMVKNASSLYYPIKQVIMSVLPIVDEFVVALGDCSEDDDTVSQIRSINSNKIKIINTVWDLKKYPKGTENAHQTDIAKENCSGDWLFYLQADEVVHEKYLPVIKKKCEDLLDDKKVEGIIFNYVHFWGDYDHYHLSHCWYKNEIRIVRNNKDIHSWESAQSFRKIPDFNGLNYRQQENTFMLKVAKVDAYIYHYGWVRPPAFMQKKNKALDTIHKGKEKAETIYKDKLMSYDYGALESIAKFSGTHPKVMEEWIEKFDWKDQLNYSKKIDNRNRKKHKHERLKYRIVTFIEQNLLNGRSIGGFKNYILLKGKKYR